MEAQEFLRIVALRKGRLKPAEFMLRPGEKGLSLFAYGAGISPVEIVEAVRSAGKQGDLAAAVLAAKGLRGLGLTLVHTLGGTPMAEVNAVHYEARLSFARRVFLWLRGVSISAYFNDHLSPKLCALARVLD